MHHGVCILKKAKSDGSTKQHALDARGAIYVYCLPAWAPVSYSSSRVSLSPPAHSGCDIKWHAICANVHHGSKSKSTRRQLLTLSMQSQPQLDTVACCLQPNNLS